MVAHLFSWKYFWHTLLEKVVRKIVVVDRKAPPRSGRVPLFDTHLVGASVETGGEPRWKQVGKPRWKQVGEPRWKQVGEPRWGASVETGWESALVLTHTYKVPLLASTRV